MCIDAVTTAACGHLEFAVLALPAVERVSRLPDSALDAGITIDKTVDDLLAPDEAAAKLTGGSNGR